MKETIDKSLKYLTFLSLKLNGTTALEKYNTFPLSVKITFTKSDGSDPTEAANQDRLTSNIWITRGIDGGQIYNSAKESSATQATSPAGTKWSVGTIDQVSTLTFNNFRTAVGKPKDVVGKNLVMFLVDDKIYLSVKFTSWGQGKGGGFAYERSTK